MSGQKSGDAFECYWCGKVFTGEHYCSNAEVTFYDDGKPTLNEFINALVKLRDSGYGDLPVVLEFITGHANHEGSTAAVRVEVRADWPRDPDRPRVKIIGG